MTKGGGVFVQRPVRSDFIVIVSIILQSLTQVTFAQDDEVIEALAPDRSDQPFSKAVLPRRPNRSVGGEAALAAVQYLANGEAIILGFKPPARLEPVCD